MLMLLFTFVFGNAIDPSGQYVDYVVPGIILLCAGFGAASTAVYVAGDCRPASSTASARCRCAAARCSPGTSISSLVRNLLATGVVIGVALLVGFRPTADFGAGSAAIGMIALYILTITYLFAAIGLAAGSPEAASGYGFIILFLPYLSSAFVPVETMPSWLQWIAENQPVTPIIETIRGAAVRTCRWARSRGGRSAGASESCWCRSCGARGCSGARPGVAERRRVSGRAAS